MTTHIDRYPLFSFASRAADLLQLFQRWWLAEFHTLLSNRVGRWLLGSQRKALRLKLRSDAVHIVLDGLDQDTSISTQITAKDYSRRALDDFFQNHKLASSGVNITLSLPFNNFFCRTLVLPRAALSRIDEIVVRDMATKTPFHPGEVHHHHSVESSADPAKVVVCQWIVKRKFIDEALSKLQMSIEEIAFVDAENPPQQTQLPLIVLHSSERSRPWYWSSIRMLVLGAIILSAVAVGARIWRQQSTIEDLDLQISAVRTKAQRVGAQVANLEKKRAAIVRVRTEKATSSGLLDVLEGATAVLPPHSWLTELQISQSGGNSASRQITLVGFSEAAASLVGLLAKSAMFEDASLTSPISIDPIEGRERFSIQMKLKNPGAERLEAR
jgi:general secretion pathway protein L